MMKTKYALLLVGILSVTIVATVLVNAQSKSLPGRETALLFAETAADSQILASLNGAEVSQGMVDRASEFNRQSDSPRSDDALLEEVVRTIFAEAIALDTAARNNRTLTIDDVQSNIDAQRELCEDVEKNPDCVDYLDGLIEAGLADNYEEIWTQTSAEYARQGTKKIEFELYLKEQNQEDSMNEVREGLRIEWERSLLEAHFDEISWNDQEMKTVVGQQLGIATK